MKQLLVIPLSAAAIAACQEPQPSPAMATDQCMRREIFLQCLERLPKGPERVHNSNDWEEVVAKCDSVAYYQARRLPQHVKSECTAP